MFRKTCRKSGQMETDPLADEPDPLSCGQKYIKSEPQPDVECGDMFIEPAEQPVKVEEDCQELEIMPETIVEQNQKTLNDRRRLRPTKADFDIISNMLEPEMQIDVLPSTQERGQSVRRCSQRNSKQGEQTKLDTPLSRYLRKAERCTVEANGSIFPITDELRKRIHRMKNRMINTLLLTKDKLEERRRKRQQQTRESRERLKSADAESYRLTTNAKRRHFFRLRKELIETPEEIAERRAKRREEARLYLAKLRATETPEQRAARREYQKQAYKRTKPIKF